MKVALLTDGIYPFVVGGMQRHSYLMAKYLAKNKVAVHVVHCVFENNLIDYNECFSKQELEFLTFEIVEFPTSIKFFGHYIYNSYRYSKLVCSVIENRISEFDFIYTKGFSGWFLLKQKLKGQKCPPIGVNFHGYEMFQVPPNNILKLAFTYLKPPTKWITNNADVVFSYGSKITSLIEQIGSKKIVEIPAGIEIEENTVGEQVKNAKNLKFVFVGRNERRKGIEEINYAIKSLIMGKKTFEFHLIGTIDDKWRIHEPNVFYHGAIKRKKNLFEIIKLMDVLVAPSYSEGMPNVILEGMLNRLAIIATDVGAVSLMVDKNNGILLNKPTEVLGAMEKLIALDKSVLKDWQEVSYKRVNESFSMETVTSKLIKNLRTLVQ